MKGREYFSRIARQKSATSFGSCPSSIVGSWSNIPLDEINIAKITGEICNPKKVVKDSTQEVTTQDTVLFCSHQKS